MKKVLIIRFSSIGDIVLTTPVIRNLKNNGYEVHYITKKQFKTVIENNQYIDKLHLIDDVNTLGKTIKILKKECFDYIIDLHNNFRSFKVKKALRVTSYSFNKLNFRKLILVRTGINIMPKKHIVDRYLDTLKRLNIKLDDKGLDYNIPLKDYLDLSKNLPEKFISNFVSYVIGGTYQGKRMPADKIVEVINNSNANFVLLGGKEDVENGSYIVRNVKSKNVISFCGEINLNQSASVIKQSNIVITNDTGLMHIASAFQKNIISLWGCTSPILGMNPYKAGIKSVEIQPNNLDKRPCSKLGNKCKYPNWKCVHELPEIEIIETIKKLSL